MLWNSKYCDLASWRKHMFSNQSADVDIIIFIAILHVSKITQKNKMILYEVNCNENVRIIYREKISVLQSTLCACLFVKQSDYIPDQKPKCSRCRR